MYEATEFQSLIAYVEHGLAIAAIPRLGRGTLPDGLVPIPLRDETACREIALVVRQSTTAKPTREAIIAALYQAASAALDRDAIRAEAREEPAADPT